MPQAFFGKLRTLFGARESEAAKKITQRDPRYVIRGSLLYRPAGGMDWQKGFTENLSANGVLFRGEAPLPVNTPLEMSITPPKAPGQRPRKALLLGHDCPRNGPGTSIKPVFGVVDISHLPNSSPTRISSSNEWFEPIRRFTKIRLNLFEESSALGRLHLGPGFGELAIVTAAR
jgi:hypothetical protein